MKNKYLLIWLFIALCLIAVDQWTKSLATTHLQYGRPVPVTEFLNWFLVHNPGAAFSFLSNAGGWQKWFFSGIAIFASIFITVLIMQKPHAFRYCFALSCILSGAIGNLIDRLRFGYVVDFIDVYYKNHHWPAFNIADSAITIGVIILIVDEFLSNKSSQS